MDLRRKLQQVISISRHSPHPLPMVIDLLRLKRRDYVADCKGLEFALRAHRHEWYAVFENVIQEDYLRHGIVIRPGDTVLDIGAGFGSFAVMAARKAGSDGLVVAYEPDPAACTRIARNAERNRLRNVRVINAAVGGADGEVDLFLQERSHLNTLFQRVDHRPVATTAKIRVRAVSIASALAAIGRPVDLLKIHCEGSEYEIVDGIEAAPARIGQIAMEVHQIDGRNAQDIVDTLTALGFRTIHQHPMIFARRLAP
jgi:FkbM family methyltransferase